MTIPVQDDTYATTPPGTAWVSVGLLTLHLRTGATTILGFVCGKNGAPEFGSPMFRARPVAEGGRITLHEGLDPMRRSTTTGPVVELRFEPRGFDSHGFDWAGRATSDAQADAAARGWQVITRWQAAQALTTAGYTVPSRFDTTGRPNFHTVLWEDQADNLTWHLQEGQDGRRFDAGRAAFVLPGAML